jgi:hypothetical protein
LPPEFSFSGWLGDMPGRNRVDRHGAEIRVGATSLLRT